MKTKPAQWGGARPNSGPRPDPRDGVLATGCYRLPTWQIDGLKAEATRQHTTPSALLRQLVEAALRPAQNPSKNRNK